MTLSPEEIVIEHYLNEVARDKHKKNEDFLRLAITNIELAKGLGLSKGLTYDCSDGCFFEVIMPNGERAFYRHCKYGYPEPRITVLGHYTFLKNNWIEEAVDIDSFVDEALHAYNPLAETLSRRNIHTALINYYYCRKIFKYDASKTTIKPIHLPVKIEL